MTEEEEIKKRLKDEIDRMKIVDLKNLSKSKESFLGWVKNTIKRIWNYVVDEVIIRVGDWLWDGIKKIAKTYIGNSGWGYQL